MRKPTPPVRQVRDVVEILAKYLFQSNFKFILFKNKRKSNFCVDNIFSAFRSVSIVAMVVGSIAGFRPASRHILGNPMTNDTNNKINELHNNNLNFYLNLSVVK